MNANQDLTSGVLILLCCPLQLIFAHSIQLFVLQNELLPQIWKLILVL